MKKSDTTELRKLDEELKTLKQYHINLNEKHKTLKTEYDQKREILSSKIKFTSEAKPLTRNNIINFKDSDEIQFELTNNKLNDQEQRNLKKLPRVQSREVKGNGIVEKKKKTT